MKAYATPLAERLRIAAYYRERYKRDPEWRLRKLNRSRAGFGLEPRQSVDEILTREEIKQVAAEMAQARQRCDKGRFA